MAKRTMPVKKEEPLFSDKVYSSEIDEKEESSKSKEPMKVMVANCSVLNVREGPGKQTKVLFTIPAGTIVQIEGMIMDSMENEWFYVRLLKNKNQDGYILAQYTSEV